MMWRFPNLETNLLLAFTSTCTVLPPCHTSIFKYRSFVTITCKKMKYVTELSSSNTQETSVQQRESCLQLGEGSQDLQVGGGVELMSSETNTRLLTLQGFRLDPHAVTVTVGVTQQYQSVNLSASLPCGLPTARYHGDATCSQLKRPHCYCVQNQLQSHRHKPDVEQLNQLQPASITTDIPLH